MARFTLREATGSDARFLGDMLVEASEWMPSRSRSRVDVLADPKTAKYIAGWKRPGDAGTVAIDSTGTPLGACWYRLRPAHDPGYGFVAAGVPELTLGVVPVWRAQGIGRALLNAVVAQARASGHTRISLSVERANYAQRLYVSEGFHTVLAGENADTMVRILR
ncbi:MAG: GNAT family N-acetyltransferase [Mycetocola sp.]